MKKGDKLREAIEKQAATLEPAQHEFVMAHYRTYQWNADKIESLESELEEGVIDPETGRHNYQAEAALFKQRHQLVTQQNTIFSHIMRWLKGTSVSESELDEFL